MHATSADDDSTYVQSLNINQRSSSKTFINNENKRRYINKQTQQVLGQCMEQFQSS